MGSTSRTRAPPNNSDMIPIGNKTRCMDTFKLAKYLFKKGWAKTLQDNNSNIVSRNKTIPISLKERTKPVM